DRLVVFGGYAAPSPPYYQYDDLWTLSFAGGTPSWTRHDAPDPRPSARMLSTMVYDSKRDRFLLMFGVHAATLLTEVWELRFPPEATWRQIFPAFAGPVARAAAMGVFDPLRDRVVVFGGGVGGGTQVNDTWTLEGLDAGFGKWVYHPP